MSTQTWRLITSPPGDGPWNFALDEALAASDKGPILRFYGWANLCLSLGRFQELSAAFDPSHLLAQGITLVRRPTGGRAILHHGREVTYSVTAPATHWLAQEGVMESYRAINTALAAGLRQLGVHAQEMARAPASSGPDTNLACFEKAYRHEVFVDGRKIVASAQSRSGGNFLQQGTVPLTRTGTLFAAATTLPFLEKAALARRLDNMTATPEDSLHRQITFSEAAEALASGFNEIFKVSLVEGVPTPEEEAAARRIMQERYLNWDWTANRAVPASQVSAPHFPTG